MHELLAAHWSGYGWKLRWKEMAEQFNSMFDEEKEFYGDLPTESARMFKAYLRRWKDDEEKFRTARLPNGDPAIEFVIEVPLTQYGIKSPFKARIDLLVEDLEYGGVWIRDAKWVRSLPNTVDDVMMSPQNIMYVWAMRKLGWDLRGFIYDYGRTKSPTVPPTLARGGISLAKKYDTDRATFYAAMVNAHGKQGAKKLAKTVYKGKLDELKAREPTWYTRQRITVEGDRIRNGLREFVSAVREIDRRGTKSVPRTFLYNCKWNCAYYDPCVAEFNGLDIENLLKSQYTLDNETYGPEEVD